MKPVRIQKTYDVICPYCYLGLKAFEEASRNTNIPIIFEHHPFLLHKGVPYEGIRIGDYLSHLSSEQRNAMYAGQQKAAAALGITIKDGDDLIVRNSVAAHIAIEYAAGFNKADEALEAFFKAHFTDQTPIDRIPEILEIMSGVIPDLDTKALTATLEDPQSAARIQQAADEARASGVQSVPTYEINSAILGGSLSVADAEKVLSNAASGEI